MYSLIEEQLSGSKDENVDVLDSPTQFVVNVLDSLTQLMKGIKIHQWMVGPWFRWGDVGRSAWWRIEKDVPWVRWGQQWWWWKDGIFIFIIIIYIYIYIYRFWIFVFSAV